MLPTKPGQDREPNLPGLLVRIRVTVFDLAGGLQGNGGELEGVREVERIHFPSWSNSLTGGL